MSDPTSNIFAHGNPMHTSDLKFDMCASDPSGPYMAQSSLIGGGWENAVSVKSFMQKVFVFEI